MGRFQGESPGTEGGDHGEQYVQTCFWRVAFFPRCLQVRLNPQASSRQCPLGGLLITLIFEIDTIPKPHGLGKPARHIYSEQSSINVGQYLKKIEVCPRRFGSRTVKVTTVSK
jgi:hypothetical protein